MLKESVINAALAYIGKKLDVLIELSKGSKINIDLGSSTQQLEKAAENLTKSSTAIDKLSATNEKSISKVIASLETLSASEREKASALVAAITRFEDILRKESNHPAVSAQVSQLENLNELNANILSALKDDQTPEKLDAAIQAIQAIKLEEKETDLSPVTTELRNLLTSIVALRNDTIANSPKRLEALVTELITAVKALKLNVPKEFKLEEMQMRMLSHGSGGSGVAVVGGNDLEKYKVSDIDDDASPNYYGFIEKSGAWYILKEDTSAKTYRYVGGRSAYTTNWTNRASLTYTYFNAANII